MKTIPFAHYQRLLRLREQTDRAWKVIDAVKAEAMAITGETDEYGFCSDCFMAQAIGVDQVLGSLQITVEPKSNRGRPRKTEAPETVGHG